MPHLTSLARSCAFAAASSSLLAACTSTQHALPPQEPGGGAGAIPAGPANSSVPPSQPPLPQPGGTAAPIADDAALATTYKGCRVFTPGDAYGAQVASAKVDPQSASYLKSAMAVDDTGFYGSVGIEPVDVATSATLLYRVRQKVSWHTFPVPYPFAPSFRVEPDGDAHLIVVLATPPACRLYESYSTSFEGGVLSAYSGANWDLSQPYKIANGSSMASGLSLFAGSVRHEEIATGIHHALNFSLFSHAPCDCFVAPASGTDGLAYEGPPSAYELPYGAHLRLKASFDEAGYGAQSRAILDALKHYGSYLADTGGHYENNNRLYLTDPTDGGSWNQEDLGALRNLRLSDFDVLELGRITRL